jgi:hypothetical protein
MLRAVGPKPDQDDRTWSLDAPNTPPPYAFGGSYTGMDQPRHCQVIKIHGKISLNKHNILVWNSKACQAQTTQQSMN